MNAIIRFALLFCLATTALAQTIAVQPDAVKWISKNSTDTITINNGNGNILTISINVDKPAPPSTSSSSPATIPGVNLTNCGDTKHIDAGSSAVCTTKDASNPVSFSSDSPTFAASGSYIITQR